MFETKSKSTTSCRSPHLHLRYWQAEWTTFAQPRWRQRSTAPDFCCFCSFSLTLWPHSSIAGANPPRLWGPLEDSRRWTWISPRAVTLACINFVNICVDTGQCSASNSIRELESGRVKTWKKQKKSKKARALADKNQLIFECFCMTFRKQYWMESITN